MKTYIYCLYLTVISFLVGLTCPAWAAVMGRSVMVTWASISKAAKKTVKTMAKEFVKDAADKVVKGKLRKPPGDAGKAGGSKGQGKGADSIHRRTSHLPQSPEERDHEGQTDLQQTSLFTTPPKGSSFQKAPDPFTIEYALSALAASDKDESQQSKEDPLQNVVAYKAGVVVMSSTESAENEHTPVAEWRLFAMPSDPCATVLELCLQKLHGAPTSFFIKIPQQQDRLLMPGKQADDSLSEKVIAQLSEIIEKSYNVAIPRNAIFTFVETVPTVSTEEGPGLALKAYQHIDNQPDNLVEGPTGAEQFKPLCNTPLLSSGRHDELVCEQQVRDSGYSDNISGTGDGMPKQGDTVTDNAVGDPAVQARPFNDQAMSKIKPSITEHAISREYHKPFTMQEFTETVIGHVNLGEIAAAPKAFKSAHRPVIAVEQEVMTIQGPVLKSTGAPQPQKFSIVAPEQHSTLQSREPVTLVGQKSTQNADPLDEAPVVGGIPDNNKKELAIEQSPQALPSSDTPSGDTPSGEVSYDATPSGQEPFGGTRATGLVFANLPPAQESPYLGLTKVSSGSENYGSVARETLGSASFFTASVTEKPVQQPAPALVPMNASPSTKNPIFTTPADEPLQTAELNPIHAPSPLLDEAKNIATCESPKCVASDSGQPISKSYSWLLACLSGIGMGIKRLFSRHSISKLVNKMLNLLGW